jgi:putative membrane protein
LSLVRLNLRALAPIAVGIVGGAQFLPDVLGPLVATPLTGALLVVLGTVLAGPVETFVRYYDFRLIDAGDELRYERGLIQRYSGSIPIEKIQTLLVHENVLERRLGYAGLDTITAGYAVSSVTDGTPSAIPLAGRDSVWQFARTVDGFDFEDVSFTLPPKRARRRYMGRYTVLVGTVTGVAAALDMFAGASVAIFEYQFTVPVLPGLDYWFILLGLLALVPLAAHLKWRNRGYAVTESHVLTRNGFWNRGIQIVPYYRLQTAIHRRSLFQRRLGLSTVVVDTAGTGPLSLIGGSARAVDIGTEEAQELRETIRERFGTSLSARRRTTGEQAAST